MLLNAGVMQRIEMEGCGFPYLDLGCKKMLFCSSFFNITFN